MTPEQWIISGDTGVSSKTIWAVMMNAIPDKPGHFDFDVPHDPADFGRCYRLLEAFPEWKNKLHKVSEKFINWKPLIENWEKLTALFEKESLNNRCPELYALMQKLNDEGKRLDGWIETSPGCWKKEKQS